MDQELVVPTAVPSFGQSFGPLRLALIVVAAVAGGFLLSLALGSSPASAAESALADDPITTPVTGTVVPGLVDRVSQTVTTIAHASPAGAVTSPLTATVDAAVASTPLAPVTGAQPTTAIVSPVAQLLDDTLAALTAPLAPILGPILSAPTASGSAPSAQVVPPASAALVLAATVSGAAIGLLSLAPGSSPEHGVLTGSSSAASGLAVAMGAGFIVLLAAARRRAPFGAIPASPVYETDSSPD